MADAEGTKQELGVVTEALKLISDTSKIFKVLIALLGVGVTIGGMLWHLSTQLATLATVQAMHDQQIKSLGETSKALENSRRDQEDNFNKMIMIMATIHDSEHKR